MKKRLTYWLAEKMTGLHLNKATLLDKQGFDIHFFKTVEDLLKELEEHRVSTILISDFAAEENMKKAFYSLLNMPELQAARFIFALENCTPSVLRIAASGNVRDIIPLNISDDQWLKRIIFTAALGPVEYIQPSGQLTMNSVCSVSLPARLIWLTDRRIRFECRVKPPIGTKLHLSGLLVRSLELPQLTITVEETHRTHLLYRFSDAVVASFEVPIDKKPSFYNLLKNLQKQDVGPKCRVFIAIQSATIRNRLLQELDNPRFEINTALQKKSLSSEPLFFSPHIVFIEEALCLEDGGKRFYNMAKNLDKGSVIAVIGNGESFPDISAKCPGRKIFILPSVPSNLIEVIFGQYLDRNWKITGHSDNAAINIMSESLFSFANVSLPARLTSLHPIAARLSFPFALGNFALCQIESPLLRKILGKNPFAKLTKVFSRQEGANSSFIYSGECYFVDVGANEQANLAGHLTKLVSDYFLRYISLDKQKTQQKTDLTSEQSESSTLSSGILEATSAEEIKASSLQIEQYDEIPSSTLSEVVELLEPAAQKISLIKDTFWKKTVKNLRSETLRHLVIWIGLSACLLGLIWALITVVAPHWEKHGSQYTKSLYDFAPHLKSQNSKDNSPKGD